MPFGLSICAVIGHICSQSNLGNISDVDRYSLHQNAKFKTSDIYKWKKYANILAMLTFYLFEKSRVLFLKEMKNYNLQKVFILPKCGQFEGLLGSIKKYFIIQKNKIISIFNCSPFSGYLAIFVKVSGGYFYQQLKKRKEDLVILDPSPRRRKWMKIYGKWRSRRKIFGVGQYWKWRKNRERKEGKHLACK